VTVEKKFGGTLLVVSRHALKLFFPSGGVDGKKEEERLLGDEKGAKRGGGHGRNSLRRRRWKDSTSISTKERRGGCSGRFEPGQTSVVDGEGGS